MNGYFTEKCAAAMGMCYNSRRKEVEKMRSKDSLQGLTKTAMMAAVVFVSIYLFKIPVPNGYVHLGDCMIFIGVLLLGKKRGALAGGIGAAFSDLLAGYMFWVFPTFFIKYIMAMVMGFFAERILPEQKWGWLLGAVAGGIIQIVLYATVECSMFGLAYSIVNVPANALQTGVGVLLAGVLVALFRKSGIWIRLKEI